MKCVILAVALMLSALTTRTFAADVKVTPTTLFTFQVNFSDATNVQWTAVDNLYRADFTINGEQTIAYFSKADGTLVVTCRYLTVAELPRELQRSLKTKMVDATLIELYQIQNNDTVDYYATIVQADKLTIWKSANGKWDVFKK